jgi:hypothetical protein
MEEPNKFRRPKARLKTANSTEAPSNAPSKSVSSLKSNYDLQIVILRLENKIEKLEDKLLEKENRISELTIENTELVEQLEEYENSEQLGDEPQMTMGEKMITELAPLVPSLIDRIFANQDRNYELSMILAKQAEERIRMQKEQGIGNGTFE